MNQNYFMRFLKPILSLTLGLILFIGFSAFTSKKSKTKKAVMPKNIIFMVGDGMGLTQVTAGMYRNGGHLNLERAQHFGFIKTHSADQLITDSAAGATAFATGHKTNNKMLSQSPTDSTDMKTILEYAEENGLSTGIVTTCATFHATPAAFFSHYYNRNFPEEISVQFLNQAIEVLITGGYKHFTDRKDGRNLVDELSQKGYTFMDTLTAETSMKNIEKLICLYADEHPASINEGRGDILSVGVEKALDILSRNDQGFFLLTEGSQIDWGGHANNSEYIISEMIDFDKAVKKAFDFADKNGETLVIITADHETGGYSIVEGSQDGQNLKGEFTTKHHTPDLIPVYAYGQGSEMFSGIYQNTAIFDKMMRIYGFKK